MKKRLLALLLLVPLLSGCGMIEGAISQATGGDVDVSIGSLPDGWPTEVPVTEGDIIGGGSAETDGEPVWNVTVKTSTNVFDAISAQLTSAGFTAVDTGPLEGTDNVSGGAFTNDAYSVLVGVSGDADAWIVNYTVTTAAPAP